MVTRDPELQTYGDVAARASQLRFVLPPRGSGSAATFENLMRLDPYGLGEANKIVYATSTTRPLKSR